jgi:hypothetical protein
MYVVPKHQTSATLFGRDGSVRLFKTRREALRELGASFIRHQVGPDFKTPRHFSHVHYSDWSVSLYAFILLDDAGKPLSIADFEDLLPPRKQRSWHRTFGEYGVRHPGHKPSNGRCYRRPKTIAEKRLHSLVLVEDMEPAVRGRRKPPNLADTWDDIRFFHEKSWKSHRKTQYKNKGEPA